MKKISTILLMSAVMPALVNVKAEVLFTESFQLATDAAVASETYDKDAATSSDWYKLGSKEFAVSEGTLKYDDYSTGAGNSLQWVSSSGKLVHLFSQKKVSDAGSVYVSALIHPTVDMTATKTYFLALSKTKDAATAGNHVARVHIFKDGEGFRLGIAKNTEASGYLRYTPSVYDFDKTYLVVAEYRYVDGSSNDEVLLYVNPLKGDKPAVATVTCVQDTLTGSDVQQGAKKADDAVNMVGVVLNGTATIKNMKIDELKVCTDWSNLWIANSGDKIPTLEVNVYDIAAGVLGQGEKKEVKFVVTGKDLSESIQLSSTHKEVSISPSVISMEDAVGGKEVTVTINPELTGVQNALIEVSAGKSVSGQEVNISWTTVLGASDIEKLRSGARVDEQIRLLGDAVVVYKFSDLSYDYACVQDKSGAIILSNGGGYEIGGLAVGDKISGFDAILKSDDGMQEEKVNGLKAVVLLSEAKVVASGVEIEPMEATIQDIRTYTDKYGAALVKLTDVEIVSSNQQFIAANYAIRQGVNQATICISAGCDIIGEDIPESADLTGVVRSSDAMIQLRRSADLTNRVAKVPSGLDEILTDSSVEVYTILGSRVTGELQPGAYIIKSATETKKVVIR